QYVVVRNLGSTTADAINLYQAASSSVTIQHTSFSASSSIHLYTYGSSAVTFTDNTVLADSIVPIDYRDPAVSRYAFQAVGPSTAPKFFQGNKILRSWVDLSGSVNWTIGGDTDALGNIIIGPRAGLWVGKDSTVKRTYTHADLSVTPSAPYWSQLGNFRVDCGSVAEYN